jgi:hypothetical protein
MGSAGRSYRCIRAFLSFILCFRSEVCPVLKMNARSGIDLGRNQHVLACYCVHDTLRPIFHWTLLVLYAVVATSNWAEQLRPSNYDKQNACNLTPVYLSVACTSRDKLASCLNWFFVWVGRCDTVTWHIGHSLACCVSSGWYIVMMRNVGQLVEWNRQRKQKYRVKCHFVYHKSHMVCDGIEPGSRGKRSTGNRLSYGTTIFYHV